MTHAITIKALTKEYPPRVKALRGISLTINAGEFFALLGPNGAGKTTTINILTGLTNKTSGEVFLFGKDVIQDYQQARALMHHPKILILDEPTAGVDVETRQLLWTYFRQLNQQGTTILLTTHYIEEAEQLCQRIAVINHGEIIALDKKEKLLTLLDQQTIRLYLNREMRVPEGLQKYNPKKEGTMLTFEFSLKKTSYGQFLEDLHRSKLPFVRLEASKASLEEVFLHLTKK